jgi:hypothetical protein
MNKRTKAELYFSTLTSYHFDLLILVGLESLWLGCPIHVTRERGCEPETARQQSNTVPINTLNPVTLDGQLITELHLGNVRGLLPEGSTSQPPKPPNRFPSKYDVSLHHYYGDRGINWWDYRACRHWTHCKTQFRRCARYKAQYLFAMCPRNIL